MSKICLCLTGKTIERNLEILEEFRRYVDLAELRVDCLLPDERFFIRGFPEKAGLPVILTVRRRMDGGFFDDGEGSRVTLLSQGLAFAEADRRHNFAYVDLEEDLEVPGLEEAARTFGTRIIRSRHNLEGMDDDIAQKMRSMRRVGDEIVKIAFNPKSLKDTVLAYRAAKETMDIDKIIVCMGSFGTNLRILAEKAGCFLTYCSAAGKKDVPLAAPGQISPAEITDVYRFREIKKSTRVLGLAGFPLTSSYSPHIFNMAFTHENINAVYLPFPSGSTGDFLEMAEELGMAGAGITIPYKEEIIPRLAKADISVKAAGACNTLVPRPEEGWEGYNTDMSGFSESLLSFTGKKNLHGMRITVLGAGGAARAAVSEIARLKGRCLVLNRDPARARELAVPHRFKWGSLDSQGLDMMDKFSAIIVQATSVGMYPNVEADPFPRYHFTGKEVVMDLIYRPSQTAFLKRAEAAGCKTLNGFDMLVRQAQHQYQCFFGRDYPVELRPRLEELIAQYPV